MSQSTSIQSDQSDIELRDPTGRPIGRVVEPIRHPSFGRGAETVLLVRDRP